MVSKDQSIGGIIFAVCVVIGLLYTVGLFYYGNPFSADSSWTIQFWLIALPVFIAFIAVMGVGAWIGWTMATTPPPKPIEEITSEVEEKKEEKVEETEEPKGTEETTEEKKLKRKG